MAAGKEHPLVVGQTLLSGGQPSSQLYSFRYDFQPASVQKATSGVLVLDKDSKVLLEPHTSAGEQEGYYEGNLEVSRNDPDNMDCIAIFDGQQWTLELLAGTIKSRHKRGRPSSIASSAPVAGRAAAQPAASPSPRPSHWASEEQRLGSVSPYGYAAAARTPGADEPSSAEEGEVASPPQGQPTHDGDLDAALNEALFEGGDEAADGSMEEQGDVQEEEEEPSSAGENRRLEDTRPVHKAHQQPTQHQQQPQQHQQQQQRQQQQPVASANGQSRHQHHQPPALDEAGASDESEQPADEGDEEDHDSVWEQFGAAALSAPEAPAAVAHDEEEDSDEAANMCSDDHSDGLGVEVF